MRVAVQVIATQQIAEQDFPTLGRTHVHAEPGDVGEIVHVSPSGHPLVKFLRTGTCVDVELFENALLRGVD